MYSFSNYATTTELAPNVHRVEKEFSLLDDIGNIVTTVPKGFITDFYSIPFPFDRIITRADLPKRPAIVHDFDYNIQEKERWKADYDLLKAMEAEKMWLFERRTIYYPVRMFGWIPWNNKDRKGMINIGN